MFYEVSEITRHDLTSFEVNNISGIKSKKIYRLRDFFNDENFLKSDVIFLNISSFTLKIIAYLFICKINKKKIVTEVITNNYDLDDIAKKTFINRLVVVLSNSQNFHSLFRSINVAISRRVVRYITPVDCIMSLTHAQAVAYPAHGRKTKILLGQSSDLERLERIKNKSNENVENCNEKIRGIVFIDQAINSHPELKKYEKYFNFEGKYYDYITKLALYNIKKDSEKFYILKHPTSNINDYPKSVHEYLIDLEFFLQIIEGVKIIGHFSLLIDLVVYANRPLILLDLPVDDLSIKINKLARQIGVQIGNLKDNEDDIIFSYPKNREEYLKNKGLYRRDVTNAICLINYLKIMDTNFE